MYKKLKRNLVCIFLVLAVCFLVSSITGIMGCAKAPQIEQYKEQHKIAFQGYSDVATIGLRTINLDGTGDREIKTGMYIYCFDWSSDGTKIAFTAKKPSRELNMKEMEVYVSNSDGSNIRRLTKNQVEESIVAWSPDGKRIGYVTDQDGNSEIYVMNADGSGKRNLTNHPAEDCSFDWSPDGSKILFLSNRDGEWNIYNIYTMNADDGSNVTKLISSPASARSIGSIKWSPNGKEIIFEIFTDQKYPDVYIMNLDGSNLRKLVDKPMRPGFYGHYDPFWFPDGKQILLVRNIKVDREAVLPPNPNEPPEVLIGDIYIIDRNGKSEHNVTKGKVFVHGSPMFVKITE